VPTLTTVPSGHVIVAGGGGGGGGGGGQGTAASITDPSGQVCVGGVVAQADTPTTSARSSNFFMLSSLVSGRQRKLRRSVPIA
jgi:hypothetical protein